MNNFAEVMARREKFSRRNKKSCQKKNENKSINLFHVSIKASMALFQAVSTMSFQEI